MGRRICPLCEHQSMCKFWEELTRLTIGDQVDWIDEAKFRKWRERFARFCMYFTLDEDNLNALYPSLEFLFRDYVVAENTTDNDKEEIKSDIL